MIITLPLKLLIIFPTGYVTLGKVLPSRPDGSNDHCGFIKLRIAVGATLYGLEFGNQIIFDYGIRNLEVTLATFVKQKAYTAQMHRGMMALGYVGR